jgi:hypothetical protein
VLVRRNGVARASGDADQRVFLGYHGSGRGDEFAGDVADCEGKFGGEYGDPVSGEHFSGDRIPIQKNAAVVMYRDGLRW